MRSPIVLLPLLLLAAAPALAIDEAEQRERIEFETQKFESHIQNNELLYRDVVLNDYLQEVTNRLFPDQPGRFRVRTFRDPNFNAFAVNSGGIYFHTGTLLRLTDEAQLAAVLGHEGTHVTADHMYRRIAATKKAAGIGTFLGLVGAGFGVPPVLVDVVAFSSMAGFSREHERESDDGGFERMSNAGYDSRAAGEAFAVLERELAARDIKQGGYFFASHPQVKERVETMTDLALGSKEGGERGKERYLEVTRAARMDALLQLQQSGDDKALIFLLEQENLLAILPPEARYFLAEAYRLKAQGVRRDKKDKKRPEAELEAERAAHAERAAAEYRTTIAAAPDFGPAYEPLAMYQMKQGQKAEALTLFTRFVELTPDPRQSGYARQYIERLTQELAP